MVNLFRIFLQFIIIYVRTKARFRSPTTNEISIELFSYGY